MEREGKRGRGEKGRKGREREGGRGVRLPLSKFLDPPLLRTSVYERDREIPTSLLSLIG